jgi:hypothetical protein
MKLPNGENAIVDDSKLIDYCLNLDHPIGRHHARLLEELLGFNRANMLVLKSLLVKAAREEPAEETASNRHGRKYIMRLPMTGGRGLHIIRVVWVIESGQSRPRLVTCYVE